MKWDYKSKHNLLNFNIFISNSKYEPNVRMELENNSRTETNLLKLSKYVPIDCFAKVQEQKYIVPIGILIKPHQFKPNKATASVSHLGNFEGCVLFVVFICLAFGSQSAEL